MCNVIGRGVDYDSGPYYVMISAGDTTALLNVAINDDNLLELNEEFKLSIRESSLTGRVMLNGQDETTVNIEDDDGNRLIILCVSDNFIFKPGVLACSQCMPGFLELLLSVNVCMLVCLCVCLHVCVCLPPML